MKIFYLISLFFVISCSHHHKEAAHHHHHHDDKAACKECTKKASVAYEKKCAHSVMEGDTHIEGKDEFVFAHGGRKYYFSSKEKMEAFKEHIDEHVKKANTNWENANYR